MWNLNQIAITPEILNLIAEIDEFKGAWKLYKQLAPERLLLLRKVATIESIGSSTRIEGSKLSDHEVELLLSNLQTHTFLSRDEQEVAGYAYVCDEMFQSFERMPLTENLIKQLHSWLLKFSDKDQWHRGQYKNSPNNIEAFDPSGKSLGIISETTSPFETPLRMEELIYWTRENLETKSLHPLLIIAIFVVVFLAIHPFQDGNGRLSRLLTTLLLLKTGYHYVPYSSLESIIEHNKDSYYLALRRTQESLKKPIHDFTPWLLFFLRSQQRQKNHLAQKIEREEIISLQLSPLSSQILSLLSEHSRLAIGDFETLTHANRNTLKKHLATLSKSQHITRGGKGKATWYSLPRF